MTSKIDLNKIRQEADEEYTAGRLEAFLHQRFYVLCAEVERLQTERDAAQELLDKYREGERNRLLYFRGIDPEYGGALVCKTCQGSGVKAYPSTATWHGGIGGQAITSDVCNQCWGSGDLNRKGANLKELTAKLRDYQRMLDKLGE